MASNKEDDDKLKKEFELYGKGRVVLDFKGTYVKGRGSWRDEFVAPELMIRRYLMNMGVAVPVIENLSAAEVAERRVEGRPLLKVDILSDITPSGKTPLGHVINADSLADAHDFILPLIRGLLELGANPNMAYPIGRGDNQEQLAHKITPLQAVLGTDILSHMNRPGLIKVPVHKERHFDLKAATLLVAGGADPNTVITPEFAKIFTGEFLEGRHAPPSVTPLLYALSLPNPYFRKEPAPGIEPIFQERLNLVSALLARPEIDLTARNPKGENALDIVLQTIAQEGVNPDNMAIVSALLQAGLMPQQETRIPQLLQGEIAPAPVAQAAPALQPIQFSPLQLMMSLEIPNIEGIVLKLLEAGEDPLGQVPVGARNAGLSPLIYAAKHGYKDVMKYLIEQGVDLLQSYQRKNALFYADQNLCERKLQELQALVEKGKLTEVEKEAIIQRRQDTLDRLNNAIREADHAELNEFMEALDKLPEGNKD